MGNAISSRSNFKLIAQLLEDVMGTFTRQTIRANFMAEWFIFCIESACKIRAEKPSHFYDWLLSIQLKAANLHCFMNY